MKNLKKRFYFPTYQLKGANFRGRKFSRAQIFAIDSCKFRGIIFREFAIGSEI